MNCQNFCYIELAFKKIEEIVDETVELLENGILEEFFNVKENNYTSDSFLGNLLEDIKQLTELNGSMEPIISDTRILKRRIIDNFSDYIYF